MWKKTYFAQYRSPNIVIVPTVSFSTPPVPPGPKQTAEPIKNNCTNCEQRTPVEDNVYEPATSGSNYQQDLQVVNTSTPTIEFPNDLKNSLSSKQDTISTDNSLYNISQSITKPSSANYQSRNNLVDLTGFNLLKRESMSSLTKRKDLKQVDRRSKIGKDEIQTKHEKELAYYSVNDTSKSDKIFNKESSTSAKSGNVEDHANGEPKDNPDDMEDKMKKYFRQHWKRNLNKLKDKHASSRKSCSKTKQESKDSKPESSRSKANIQKVSKSNTATDLRNKIITNSEKHRDLQRKFISKNCTRSKSETNTSHLSKSKESIRNRNIHLSPISGKRYEDFQHFIRVNDHEKKHKSENQSKTESLAHNKMVRMKSHETTINKRDIKKNEDDHKQSVKYDKHRKVSTNQTNMERPKNHSNIERARDQINKKVDLVKNVICEQKNKPDNHAQSKCANEVQDLRSRLSRKRTRNECVAIPHESMENRLDRENLVITVKQDVKTDSKNSVSLAPKVNQPKSCKRIKFVIHIEYSNTHSDDSDDDLDKCCSSPDDLSFLDDFNVDEIVDLLNNSQVEQDKIITTDNARVVNKINGNDNNAKHKYNEEIKPINYLKNDNTTKAIEIKKEETSLQKESVAYTKICKDEQIIKKNLTIERNIKQEENSLKDFTKKAYEENALEKTMDLCNDGNDSVVQVKDVSGEITHSTTLKHSLLAGNVNIVKNNEDVSNVDRIFELLRRPNQQSAKKRQGFENTIKKSHNTVNTSGEGEIKTVLIRKHEDKISLVTVDNTFNIKTKQKLESSDINDQKRTLLRTSEHPNEASLQAMIKQNDQKKSVNNTRVKSGVIKQLNTKNVKKENEKTQNTKDTVEASLKTMFNDIEQNSSSIRKHIEPNRFNGCDKKAQASSNLQKPVDAAKSSADLLNTTKKQDTSINMDIEQPNTSRHNVKKETTQATVEIPLKTMSNLVDQKHSNEIKINLSSKTNNHNKLEPEYTQKSVNKTSTETNKKCIKQNANIKINAEASNVPNIKENRLLESRGIFENVLEKKATKKIHIIPLCQPEKYITEKAEHYGKFEATQESNKYIQEKIGEQPLGSENSTNKTINLNSGKESFMATHEKDIRSQSRLSKNNKEEKISLEKSKEKMDTKENSFQRAKNKFNRPLETEENIQKKANNKKETDKPTNTIEKKTTNVKPSPLSAENYIHEKSIGLLGSENSTNKSLQNAKSTLESVTSPQVDIKPQNEPLKLFKEITKKSSKAIETGEHTPGNKSKKPLETEANMSEKKIDVIPPCTPDKNVKENLQTFEHTDKKPTNKPIDIIEKTKNEKPSPPYKKDCQETKKTLQNMKSFVQNFPASPQVENNKAKEPLKKSKETRSTSEAIITDGEQKTNITNGFNMSEKNKEQKPLLPLQDKEVVSQKSPEKVNSQQKNNVSTCVELTNADKIIEDISENTSITKPEKSLTANNKEIFSTNATPNVENQAKTFETVKNKDDDLTKTKDSNIENTNKNSDLGKTSDIATNSAKQEQVTNKSIVVVGTKGGTKLKMTPLLTELQGRICKFLHKKFNISSVIQKGRFSSIYKCNDIKGGNYAVKVVDDPQIGMYIKGMLFQMQCRLRRESCILFLIGAFEIQGKFCLLTEYFPKNLEQVLKENKRCFHIDQVQWLSKQLVDAVNVLTNARIIHSDIRPNHILLNSTQERLRLCGFDRSSYSFRAKILPNTGTSSYRAPEVILGFMEDHRIDVWSTALVMLEMATNRKLFPASLNNTILFNQICTFGGVDWSMVEQSRYRDLYFSGTSFIRRYKIQNEMRSESYLVHLMHKQESLQRTLLQAYYEDWAMGKTKWQINEDIYKLKKFHSLLKQMLTLDPRQRIPIQFVCASDFMDNQFA